MTNRTCPDCKTELTDILVFGRGWQNPFTKMAVDTGLEYYTGAKAEMNNKGMFDAQGQVEACLCPNCSRIFFYGVPAS
jgi:hypothetical protein